MSVPLVYVSAALVMLCGDSLCRVRDDSAREDTGFRAISALHAVAGLAEHMHMRMDVVTDKTRFFHGDGLVFLRLRLRLSSKRGAGGMERMVRLSCGLEPAWDDEMKRRVDEILRRLASMVLASRVADPVELRLWFNLDKWEATRVNALVASISSEVQAEENKSRQEPKTETEPETSRARASVLELLRCPRYVVKAVDPKYKGRWVSQHEQAETSLRHEHALSVPTSFRSLSVNWLTTVDERLEFRQYVLRLFRVDVGGGIDVASGVAYFEFRHCGGEMAAPAICSAIPHTRCVEAVSIASSDDWSIELEACDGAWLGYALFHPDASSSTWRRLSLEMVNWKEEDGINGLLALMARGNNLHVAMGYADRSDAVDAYYTATVVAGAEIRSEPVDDKPLVWKLEAAACVDVCVSSTVVASLSLAMGSTAAVTTAVRAAMPDEWVLAVMPGYGAAWLRWRDIESVETRAAGQAFLTALKADVCGYERALVELSSGALEFLDVSNEDRLETTEMLEMVSVKCPRLRSLGLQFVGWAESLDTLSMPPQVQELHLNFDAIKTPRYLSSLVGMRRLVTLRMTADLAPPDDVVADFVPPLVRRSPYLQCFQWVQPPRRDKELEKHVSYAQRRFVTRALLPGFEAATDGFAVGEGWSLLVGAVALMSVALHRSRESDSAVGKLTRELALHVAGFAETKVERDLVVFGYWW